MGKVDPNEAPEKGVMAVSESSSGDCTGCYYDALNVPGCNEWCGAAKDRKDGCLVIFVERPTTATASWPYDSEGTPVEVPHA